MKILGINGSPRKNGNTRTIISCMLEGVQKAGGEAEYIHLPSYHIEGCIGCEKCRKEKRCAQFFDGMQLLYPKIEKADGIILGSPTYNYNMTPWMKAFIDRLYPYFDFSQQRPGPYSSRLSGKGKKALVFGVCEQIDPKEMGYTIVAMRDAIKVVGYEIFAELAFPAHFYPGSVAKDPSSREKAESAGKAFTASFQGTIA
ncbi:flavodoxin family protein [Sediminispirochaeta bajacaliforniensis]|uniref:flavodoxin family protein n=1 Tax=Sediminispirochaeta bajacaliforniensis TaxID=148 RepID=UPI00035C2EEC|nr:flavodoxin family protein [Sediminispirochaeta bajacaliforniensis]